MGENGALWGGECLRVNYRDCERLGGLPAVALLGGDLAAKQPWRNLLAHCLAFVPDWQQYPETEVVQRQNWPLLATAVSRGINAPRASSCGRLFDAVACALGIETQRYEGEAACRLEALAERCAGVDHPVTLQTDNLALFWQQWLTRRAEPGERASGFSRCAGKGLSELAATHARRRSLTTVCFSGGVLHNRLLRARLRHYLSDFTLLFSFAPARRRRSDLLRAGGGCCRPIMFTRDLKCYDFYAMNLVQRACCWLSGWLTCWPRGLAWHAFSGSTALMAASLLASVLRTASCGGCRPYRRD